MRRIASLIVIGVAMAALAGCSSGDDSGLPPVPTTTHPAGLPAASAITPNNTVVPVGSWGVVQEIIDSKDVTAVKVISLTAGKPGDFRKIKVSGADVDLDTATPYYVEFAFVNLKGQAEDTPSSDFDIASGSGANASTDGIDMLITNHVHCPPPYYHGKGPGPDYEAEKLGLEGFFCLVGLTNNTTPPTSLITDPLWSQARFSFTLPAPRK